MSFLHLPYEIIAQICSFTHVADIINLARTCSYLHSCTNMLLEVHRHKLATLSTIDDLNEDLAVSRMLGLLEKDADCEDAWYIREATFKSYRSHDPGVDANHMASILCKDGRQLDFQEAASNLGITEFHQTLHRMSEDPIYLFGVMLSLAVLRMSRISVLRFSLHPSHGNCLIHGGTLSSANGGWYIPIATTLDIFIAVVEDLYNASWPRFMDPHPERPGLHSLRTVVIEADELHSFNRLHFGKPVAPQLNHRTIRSLFHLPALKRLVFDRHRQPQPSVRNLSFNGIQYELREWEELDGRSSIEELIVVGGGWIELVEVMIRSVKQLRYLVLDQRRNELHMSNIIRVLQDRHASFLETIITPSHVSNTLSWCTVFSRLKHVILSYVDIMAAYRRHIRPVVMQDASDRESEKFQLANKLPNTIEFVALIGGQQSSSITSVRAIPLYQDIQDFLAIITSFISTRGVKTSPGVSNEVPRKLQDICFGDMRIAVTPESKAVGKTLHQFFTKAREISRLKLNKEIEKSQALQDTCHHHGVRLHITDLKTRTCTHLEQHPYVPKKPSTRQELLAEVSKWSQNADASVQETLSQYAENIPRKVRV